MVLATMFYLAQAILPHHHHEEELICIETDHCETEEYAHPHGPGHHEHDSNDQEDECSLERIVVITGNQKIQKGKQKLSKIQVNTLNGIPVTLLTFESRSYSNLLAEEFHEFSAYQSQYFNPRDPRGPPSF